MASYNFTYTYCNDPEKSNAAPHDRQEGASAMYQRFKKQMKAKNDDASEGPHMIKIGVTDHKGTPMEQYHHECACTRY